MMPIAHEDAHTAEDIDFEPEYIEDGDHGDDDAVQQQLFMPEDEDLEANNEIGNPRRVGETDQENTIHFGFHAPGVLMDFQPQLNGQVQSNTIERPIRVS